MSHYDTLGVPKDASKEEITSAYRKKAQKSHPDRKGGDVEKFQMVQRAYEVLSDNSRRARYDKTGADDQQIDDPKSLAANHVVAMFISLLDQYDIEHTDFIALIRDATKAKEAEDRMKLSSIEQAISRRRKAIKRIKRKDGRVNLFARMIESEIRGLLQAIELGKEAIAAHQHVYSLLDEYQYEIETGFLVTDSFTISGGPPRWKGFK